MGVLLFAVGLVLIIIGLSLIVGLGWAIFIMDLISGSGSTNYASAQKSFKSSKAKSGKFIGLILIISGIALIAYIFNTF